MVAERVRQPGYYSESSAWATLKRWPYLSRHVKTPHDPLDCRPSGKPAANPQELDSCLLADLETALKHVPEQSRWFTVARYRDEWTGPQMRTMFRGQLEESTCRWRARSGARTMIEWLTGQY